MAKLLNTGYKTATYFHQLDDGRAVVQTVSDVESIVERAQSLHNAGRHTNPAGDHHLAEIPIVVLNAWAEARGVTFHEVMSDNALMRDFLNDPDNAAFRVHKGQA